MAILPKQLMVGLKKRSIRIIQALLGHSMILTTRFYTQPGIKDLLDLV